MSTSFRAFWVTEAEDGSIHRSVATRNTDDLPSHEVLVKVEYAALNYKDALSASGHKGITRKFPHTPGIDAAGVVAESSSPDWKAGDRVLCTGYDLGMNTCGGFAEYIRVPAAWLVPMPDGFSSRDAMILGTAGFTAALGLYQMELNEQTPEKGPLVVSGASGGVGSMAVAIYSKAGYEVIASSGKTDSHDYLYQLGATKIISRTELIGDNFKPMISTRWAGGLDTVGGKTLEAILRATGLYGNVAVCGLVDKPEFETTVYPLIIRGVNILGVASAETPMRIRKKIWENLSSIWKPDQLELILNREIGLDDLEQAIQEILKGEIRGRVLVKM